MTFLEEHKAVAERKYRAIAGSVRIIHEPGIGTFPQSSGPIGDFILKAIRGTGATAAEQPSHIQKALVLRTESPILSPRPPRTGEQGGLA